MQYIISVYVSLTKIKQIVVNDYDLTMTIIESLDPEVYTTTLLEFMRTP